RCAHACVRGQAGTRRPQSGMDRADRIGREALRHRARHELDPAPGSRRPVDSPDRMVTLEMHKLVCAAISASASGAPVVALAADKGTLEKATPTLARLPVEGEIPSLAGATG